MNDYAAIFIHMLLGGLVFFYTLLDSTLNALLVFEDYTALASLIR